jgi:hypothetical protein
VPANSIVEWWRGRTDRRDYVRQMFVIREVDEDIVLRGWRVGMQCVSKRVRVRRRASAGLRGRGAPVRVCRG